MKNIILLLTFLISVSTLADNTISKEYYVKGMTCGGCVLGVKVALKKAEGVQFLDQNVSVGVASI